MASLNWEKIVLLTESGVCWAIRWERQLGSGPLAWGSGSQPGHTALGDLAVSGGLTGYDSGI